MRGRWYGFLLDRWDALRGSFWFFPAQMAIVSGLVALAAVEFDRRAPSEWVAAVPWLTQGSAAGARSLLSTIAGSMITVTGVVFSITVVALTLASSQFGPRLLRTFFQDRGSQLALGTFLATFFYSLLVLRSVVAPERVPYFATAGAVVLSVASLFVLIYFVHHAASSIQASTVIAAVAAEIDTQIPTLFPEQIGHGDEASLSTQAADRLERIEREGLVIRATYEGYVRVLDDEFLLNLAREHDLLVRFHVRPGDFVAEQMMLARAAPEAHVTEGVQEALAACCILGDHRTPMQDFGFLTGQLVEMAVRALSPGVNDPKTAIECVHRLGGVLARLARRGMPSGLRFDDEGVLRVVVEPTRFDAIVASCLDAIRRHGGDDPEVARALLEAIQAGAEHCEDDARRRVLEEHAREVHEAYTAGQNPSKRDGATVEAAFQRTMAVLEAGGTRATSSPPQRFA